MVDPITEEATRTYFLQAELDRSCGSSDADLDNPPPYSGRYRDFIIDDSDSDKRLSCYYGRSEVTGTIKREDWGNASTLAVVYLISIRSVVQYCGSTFYSVQPLVPLEGEAGPLVLHPSVALVAIETTTGERLEPQVDSTQIGAAWLGPDSTLAEFVRQCSHGQVAIATQPLDEIDDDALQWTLPGVDLQEVVRYASQVAAALPNTDSEQQWQICNFRIQTAFQATMYELVRGSQVHAFTLFPQALAEAARLQCPGAATEPRAGEPRLLWFNLAAGGCGRPKGEAFADCESRIQLTNESASLLPQMGVRALGLNAGLRDARTWDGSEDTTSGLSGAATCFNGPQSAQATCSRGQTCTRTWTGGCRT